jgi:hypothetical protein
MLDCFKKIAHGLGFTNLTIAAVGMDHSQPMRNAAKSAGAERVVDCYIHVDRGMMKNRGKAARHGLHRDGPQSCPNALSHY